jgi:hypothetical protein
MSEHKFSVGEVVEARLGQVGFAPLGRFEITRLLPPTGMSNQYRLKSLANGQERVLREEQLVKDGG